MKYSLLKTISMFFLFFLQYKWQLLDEWQYWELLFYSLGMWTNFCMSGWSCKCTSNLRGLRHLLGQMSSNQGSSLLSADNRDKCPYSIGIANFTPKDMIKYSIRSIKLLNIFFPIIWPFFTLVFTRGHWTLSWAAYTLGLSYLVVTPLC